ncbi:DUF1311 domain-containing protein [Trinickia fusca]|uniref:DUF1311 domain-containing protein n=1 Tax=Trinickia fusca TaxID=2419777 RepID=A0A494X8C8_9BURK|nr:DUF1311 domain-containing protein [Trinickia fusca]
MAGIWQVREVHVNTALGRTLEYGLNDPRLMWRLFKFENNRVTDDAYDFKDDCDVTSLKTTHLNFRDLMFASIGGYGFPPASDASPMRDYKLPVDAGASVTAISLICSDGLWQGDLGVLYKDAKFIPVNGAWIALTPDGTMYLRWRDETILMLVKVRPVDITPSFDCDSAKKAAEVAICHSAELSGLDRSVAEAFSQALKKIRFVGGNERQLGEGQRSWLKQRNACNADERCLREAMKHRIDELIEQQ